MTAKNAFTLGSAALAVFVLLSGWAMGGLDSRGLDRSFFFDSDYSPIAQIVVGDQAASSDAVAAGNIAAALGNLAYTVRKENDSGGVVVETKRLLLSSPIAGATGKYVQGEREVTPGVALLDEDGKANGVADFYERHVGLAFLNGTFVYGKDGFLMYNLACNLEHSDVSVLRQEDYGNIHWLFCQGFCSDTLQNPMHTFEESIRADYSGLQWLENGLSSDDLERLQLDVDGKSFVYAVKTGELPLSRVGESDAPIDYEYRGKFLLFGEEYYVKDVAGLNEIHLAKGKVLEGISSEGFTSSFLGYKFKVDSILFAGEYKPAGVILDVETPDGKIVPVRITRLNNGVVDNLEIAGIYAEEADGVVTAKAVVYDNSQGVVLKDGSDVVVGNSSRAGWRVQFATETSDASGFRNTLDTREYVGKNGTILHNVTVTYVRDVTLRENESLFFPQRYLFTFDGYRTRDFAVPVCSGGGGVNGSIILTKDGSYSPVLAFQADDGNRYALRLDGGPFEKGELLMVQGGIMEYVDAEELTNPRRMEVSLRNVLTGNVDRINLEPYNSTKFNVTTYSFDDGESNDESFEITPDDDPEYTSVFFGTYKGLPLLYDQDRRIYFSNTTVAPNPLQIGRFDDFDGYSNRLYFWAVAENGSADLNAEPVGLHSPNLNDVLFVFENDEEEFYVVDLYDRDFNGSTDDRFYAQSVKATTHRVSSSSPVYSADVRATLNNPRDTVLYLPAGGDRLTATYGDKRMLEEVTLCHPTKHVYPTVFLGLGEQSTAVDTEITKADEGTNKTVGCCNLNVVLYNITVGGEVLRITHVISPITGNLVVTPQEANPDKNLILVGGPSVNNLTTISAGSILASSENYVVHLEGNNTLVVAGYKATDTLKAADALIGWLKGNIH
ncbi:Uncharacterised protein [uncultured archaeon]|nr:Uncharacterised protein [uncultured archaeon]